MTRTKKPTVGSSGFWKAVVAYEKMARSRPERVHVTVDLLVDSVTDL